MSRTSPDLHAPGTHLVHRRLPPLHALTVFAAASMM